MRYFKFEDITIRSNTGKGYLLTEKPNTEFGDVNKNEINYIDTDGSMIKDVYFQPRSIDINGHILADSQAELEILKRKLICSCNPKNDIELIYFNGVRKYYALAKPTSLPDFGEQRGWNIEFIVYFTIPRFYWLSEGEIQNNVFARKDILKTPFEFPTMFTTRTKKAIIVNDGDVETPCIFDIYSSNMAAKQNTPSIKLINNTTNKYIELIHTIQRGEVITINTESAPITSNINGNLITEVTPDSIFFTLVRGVNDIEAILSDTSAVVVSRHRCQYMGV